MDWSYVAGYFDGEGNVRFKAAPSRPDYILIGMTWSNTHLGSLEAIRDFIDCGRIQHKKLKKGYTNQGHQLTVHRVEDILRVGEAMLPHLIIKRDQMEVMLAWAKENRNPISKTWGALSDAGTEELSRLYHKEGMTQGEIARLFGVTPGAVATYFIRNEIKGRRRGPKEGAYGILAEHGWEKLLAMYESGMTMAEIAQELEVKEGTVRQRFWSKGVRLTKRVRKARTQRKQSLTDGKD